MEISHHFFLFQSFVDRFRDEIEIFDKDLMSREASTLIELVSVKTGILNWIKQFENTIL